MFENTENFINRCAIGIEYKNASIVLLLVFYSTALWASGRLNFDPDVRDILKLNEPTAILTNAPKPDSFDPLDADYTKNLRMMRLLYVTPLEYDKYGTIHSHLLKSFHHDEKARKISFEIATGLTYSDGSPITTQDVALAIKRLLASRPEFPVLRDIKGVKEWLKGKYPLMEELGGLTITSNTLTMTFSKEVNHPLHRFTYELFSVIPTRCVDLRTGSMKCSIPPFSGEYELVHEREKSIEFKRRSPNPKIPDVLRLVFISPVDIIKYTDVFASNHAVVANEIDIPPDHKSIIASLFRDNSMPETRIFALVMNPKSRAFESKKVRQFFAKEYRKTVKHLFHRTEGSIFTRIMPGYLSLDELEKDIAALPNQEAVKIIEHLRKYPPVRANHGYSVHSPFEIYLGATLRRLGIPDLPPKDSPNRLLEMELWKKGSYNLRQAQTGLRPPDPTDDLKMLFSKNMHYFLSDLYNDQFLQDLLSSINHTTYSKLDVGKLKTLNKWLFEESVFAVTANYPIVQLTLKSSRLHIVNDWTSNTSHYFTNDNAAR